MLKGKRIAILLTNGFEQIEMTSPREALDHAGQFTFLVSPENKVRGWNHHEPADEFTVDVPLNVAHAADFDALLLPGGVINPDTLRILPEAVAFVRDFFTLGKPVGAICHGPWSLVEANVVRGRKLTSWPSLKTDLQNPKISALSTRKSWKSSRPLRLGRNRVKNRCITGSDPAHPTPRASKTELRARQAPQSAPEVRWFRRRG